MMPDNEDIDCILHQQLSIILTKRRQFDAGSSGAAEEEATESAFEDVRSTALLDLRR
jgi:hypothetical protein